MADLPNRLDTLKCLLEQSSLRHSIDSEVLAVLDEILHRVYACEQTLERVQASTRGQERDISGVRRQLSELGYKLSEIRSSKG